MPRQATQSILQFLAVLIAELTALAAANEGRPPQSLDELYFPVLIAAGAALAIWGGSKVPTPKMPRRQKEA